MRRVDSPPRRSRATKKALRKMVEFQGIRKLALDQYRNHVKDMYDGPAGAVLAIGSLISLHEPLIGRMLRRKEFDVTRFRSILDIGSGAGQILGHLLRAASPDADLVACDLSAQMLRRARQRVKSDRPTYVAADMMQMPFVDNSFDCITCGWVIEHLPDPRPGLAEMYRLLQPGGSLLLLTTEDTNLGALTSRTWKCRTYNRDELRKDCEAVGLPWTDELWFTPLHRRLKMGGILVEAKKPVE